LILTLGVSLSRAASILDVAQVDATQAIIVDLTAFTIVWRSPDPLVSTYVTAQHVPVANVADVPQPGLVFVTTLVKTADLTTWTYEVTLKRTTHAAVQTLRTPATAQA